MKKRVLQSISLLLNDIDENITKLVKARLCKDWEAEYMAELKNEQLIVAAQQEFSFLYDYIEQNISE